MSGESRYFDNPYSDDEDDGDEALVGGDGRLLAPHSTRVMSQLKERVRRLDEGLSGDIDQSGASVYAGVAGVALAYGKLYRVLGDVGHQRESHRLVRRALELQKKKKSRGRPSFMAGDTGAMAVGAMLLEREGGELLASYLGYCDLIGRDEIEDEVLFGRAGYLLGLLYLKRHLGDDKVPDSYLKKVIDAIISSGRRSNTSSSGHHGNTSPPPLMYEWHDKVYLGAAHGTAGILYLLLRCRHLIDDHTLQTLIKPTLDWLLSLRFPSSNLPSSLGSDSDRLVHWCHGAPGLCSTLIEATVAFPGEAAKYMEAAVACGEVVWQRGLLRKGYGLCHGVSGNAYTFLHLYQATGGGKHLRRAFKFAHWCGEEGSRPHGQSDRPLSLYEGAAGPIYFLSDLLEPRQAGQPAYSF